MTWKILDCDGYSPNCKALNQTVDANPDIAGIGVIVGFLTTTCLAFMIAFTVIFLDRYERIINFFRRWFTRNQEVYSHDDHKGPYWRSPPFWSLVLSKNLLSFSDTQLLTGLAIQFTAMIKHCDMSVYHFRIVTDLAFLTTVTHLLTVIALRDYFVKYRWINLPRIFFMLGNLGLLGYTSFVGYSYDIAGLDLSMSLACFFQGERPPLKEAFGGKWAALLIGAIGGHATIILAMYWLEEPAEGQRREWWWYLGAGLRTWIVAPVYSIYGICMAGVGLRHTEALGSPNIVLKGKENDWNFGQFLPVLLLALPIFAGWESFWEERKSSEGENRFERPFRGSRGGTKSQPNVMEMKLSSSQHRGSPRDGSVEERTIESNGPSPVHTPRQRSTSRVFSPHSNYTGRSRSRPSPHHAPASSPALLAVPIPSLSPGLGIDFNPERELRSSSRARGRTT